MPLDVQYIRKTVLPILRDAGVMRSALFGSYARSEQHDGSDIDLLVEYPKKYSLFDIIELKTNLEEALGKPVDLVQYNTIKPQLKRSILSHTIPL
jgi:predicted nucleotidyltransferase